jgi:hypothetical protein
MNHDDLLFPTRGTAPTPDASQQPDLASPSPRSALLRRAPYAAVLTIAMLLAACGGGDPNDVAPVQALSAATTAQGASGTLRCEPLPQKPC